MIVLLTSSIAQKIANTLSLTGNGSAGHAEMKTAMTKAKFGKGYSPYMMAFKKWNGFNMADGLGKQALLEEWNDYLSRPGNLRLKDGETATPAATTASNKSSVPTNSRTTPAAAPAKPLQTAKTWSPPASQPHLRAGYSSTQSSSSASSLSSTEGIAHERVRQLIETALRDSSCSVRTSMYIVQGLAELSF